ncbi:MULTISPECIES: DUF1641 domain-containing protein [Haloarcula]|uniref:DUF1641 domain-containing protein n=1 Tax=Haloarcula TaxID=2237 RepID=UPI0023ECCBC2|nr:DUF1641 domain-containing protein [Halomicroarcula sp. XH51]
MSEQEQQDVEAGDDAPADPSTDLDQLTELADAVEGNEAEVAELLDRVDEVNDLLDVLALGTQAMDDEMVQKLADTGGNLGALADAAAEPATVRGAESLLHAVGDATGDLEEPPERVGVVGLLRALRDPEVQAGLGYLVAVSRHLGRDLTRRSELRQELED